MVRVPLAMFGQAMFSDTFALFFLGISVLTKVVVYDVIGTIDCYRACDVRGARVGCLIFTLLVSVLGIDLRAFRRRVREGVPVWKAQAGTRDENDGEVHEGQGVVPTVP